MTDINSDYIGGAEQSCTNPECSAPETPGTSDSAVMDLLIQNVEPLLYEYKVDLGFYGHNHAVQRHASVYQKEVMQHSTKVVNSDGSVSHVFEDPPATVHMVVGTGGAMFTMNAVNDPQPDWNELFFYEYGYAKVTAVDAGRLEWTWMNSQTNQPMDNTVIIQNSRTPSGSTSNNDDTLSPGAQAGIVIGSLLGLFIILFAIYRYFYKDPKHMASGDDEVPVQSLIHGDAVNSSSLKSVEMTNTRMEVSDVSLLARGKNGSSSSDESSSDVVPSEVHMSL